MKATSHLLAGRFAEAEQALGRARDTATGAGDHGAAARLDRLHAQLQNLQQEPGLPPLVRTARPSPGTVTAIDHCGTEHTIILQDGQVTVTSPAGTLSGAAGDDPTAAARVLAGQLAAGAAGANQAYRLHEDAAADARAQAVAGHGAAGMTTMPASVPPGEFVMVITGTQPDDLGRIQFLAYWHDPAKPADGGPPDHVRGQVFYTSVREFSARRAAEGARVTILNPGRWILGRNRARRPGHE